MLKNKGFFSNVFSAPIKILSTGKDTIKTSIPFAKTQKKSFDSWTVRARKALQNPAKTNFELAELFFKTKAYSDAIFRYKLAYFMSKEYKQAHYLIAKSYLYKGTQKKAIKYLKTAKDKGFSSPEFSYLYNIYVDNNYSSFPDINIIREFFNSFAEVANFYAKECKYKANDKIISLLNEHYDSKKGNILEVGCGAGQLGKKLKNKYPSNKITAIDISNNMINICKNLIYDNSASEEPEIFDLSKEEKKPIKKTIYDILIRKKIEDLNLEKNTKYNLVVAKGVFHYIYSLKRFTEIILQISKYLEKDSLFIFYLREKDKKELAKQIKEYSYPYFLNYHFYDFENIKLIFNKIGFSLLKEEDFELEEQSKKAKLFLFKYNGRTIAKQ